MSGKGIASASATTARLPWSRWEWLRSRWVMFRLIPLRASRCAASLGTSPNPAATSSMENCFWPVARATLSIILRVVATPPNQRLMRDMSRSEAATSSLVRAVVGVQDFRYVEPLHREQCRRVCSGDSSRRCARLDFRFGRPCRRALLDWTAGGGCPHSNPVLHFGQFFF